METSKYWLEKIISKTQFENYIGYMWKSGNNEFDLKSFMETEYCAELTRRLKREYTYEIEPMGKETLEYISDLGLNKELFENESFYTRWTIYTPLEPIPDKKYPVIFVLHGGGDAIEAAEFIPGYLEIAVQEGFIPIFPQNHNTDNILRILNIVSKKYPVDLERVYVTGHSQGGMKSFQAAYRAPEVFAAMGPCNFMFHFDEDDNGQRFPQEVFDKFKEKVVPCIQIVGCAEMLNLVPLNFYRPEINSVHLFDGWKDDPRCSRPSFTPELGNYWIGYMNWEATRSPDPRRYTEQDPTVSKWEGFKAIPYGTDADRTFLEGVNTFLALEGVAPRDIEKCLSYRNTPEDELHHEVGIYADEEYTDRYYGYKHYTLNFNNSEGVNTFRFIAVENCYHTYMTTQAQLTWNFFKNFRRDQKTGKLVVDEYEK